MNPTIPQELIDDAYERDSVSAVAEDGGKFRTDVDSPISEEAVEAVTMSGRKEIPYVGGARYWAFTDPSGGSQDSFTLAIAHNEDGVPVHDLSREVKPPFSPDSVTKEFCDILKGYKISRVYGDRYGGEWPRERFRKHGIDYQVAPKTKTDIYSGVIPMINAATVQLLDIKKLGVQLCGLERRHARGGKDSIDHGPGGHDDVANAVAGALVYASPKVEKWTKEDLWVGPPLTAATGDFPDQTVEI